MTAQQGSAIGVIMGPGIQDYSLLLHRGTQKKENRTHEPHKGMVISNGGKGHASTKGLKKQIPHVKPFPSRLGKTVSNGTEKGSHHTQGDDQQNFLCKERNRLDEDYQKNRAMGAGALLYRVQGLRKNLPEKKEKESVLQSTPSSWKCSSQCGGNRAEDALMQSFYSNKRRECKSNLEECIAEALPCTSKYPGASVNEMFLDFEAVQIIKEDADEDSASDLSDSERIPIPPSPCTPPALNLRAEEIDPVCLEHHSDAEFKESEYYYPDFLPPPFNSWDLKQLAMFVNTEGKSESPPCPAGFLEKYIDRLLQLEWLQMQTVQNEKGKAAKARPHTAPAIARALKSPAKGKAVHSPLPNKQLTPQENVAKLHTTHSGPRRDLHCEENSQLDAYPNHLKVAEVLGGSLPSQRPTCEMRSEAKKRPTTKQQLFNMKPCESSSKIQGTGNIRPPKQPAAFPSSAAPTNGLKTYSYTNPKKNGHANNYVPSKKTTGERKLKTNGTKQASYIFK
ncbi:PREDICTED: protein FAM217B [Gavialis gangeticus]|uniref:protein FAM217B n=1 Tax=Gavialis gangeticus TaxID=94835 RepID=UPI00092F82C7|nr:PREDICTED: protein FAM217B [Gavialis gangeticus]